MDRIMHLPSLDPHEHMPIGADGGQPAPPRASCKSVRQKLKDQPNKQTGWEAFFKCLSPTFAFCLHFLCFFFCFDYCGCRLGEVSMCSCQRLPPSGK